MKQILTLVIVAPILALFGGIGVLAFSVANKWDERNTDVLISNVTVACGIGGIVIALVLSAFIGLTFYARWQRDRYWSEPPGGRLGQHRLPGPPTIQHPPAWLDTPPLLPDNQEPKGRLYSLGPRAYEDLDQSLFSGGQPTDDEWRDLS